MAKKCCKKIEMLKRNLMKNVVRDEKEINMIDMCL